MACKNMGIEGVNFWEVSKTQGAILEPNVLQGLALRR